MNKLYGIILFLCFVLSKTSIAQLNTTSNGIIKKIATIGMVKIDSANIVPHTFYIENITTDNYEINYSTGFLKWNKILSVDSVIAHYRIFNFKYTSLARRYNYDSVQNFFVVQPFVFSKNEKRETSLFERNSNIQYNGSFGRSISVGNNQDAVFNSQLNLQISGLLADSIQLAAAITDNNIPIQPDGTTQQLNEFDKILLQFKKRNWEIDLGDIDLRTQQFYFLNFYKRLQGFTYQNTFSKNKLTFSGAIAKGKFVRNIFQGQEGNQGPYRLRGTNNEFYLIILAGTEKVFLDGEQMQRGEDQDYIINYNTGEITFTQKRMITKDKRIQVEFEYADRNFLNSMLYVSNEMKVNRKLTVNIAAYTNNDAKNSSINQTLNAEQKQFLANLGDSIQNAYYKTGVLDSFSNNKILYAKRVNPINANWDSIYVYSPNKDSAKYAVSFTEVGINKGNYIPFFNGANGKVYQYIAPVNGLPQGNFEAAYFLVTPKKQQVISVNTVYDIDRKTTLITDVGFSNYDVNTFSKKDKANNIGLAAKFFLTRINEFKNNHQLNTTIGYEWVDEKFKSIERLRGVEFARDWGLNILPNNATEHLPKVIIEWKNRGNNNYTKYNADAYYRADGFNAVRHSLALQATIKKYLTIITNASKSNNNGLNAKGNFYKSYAELQLKNIKTIPAQFGFIHLFENNLQKILSYDTLNTISYAFNDITAYVKNKSDAKNVWRFQYTYRANQIPQKNKLLVSDKSHNYNFSAALVENEKHKLYWNITYRELKVANTTLTNLKNDNSLLGRVEYFINEWNGFLTGNTLYESGAGQEQKRDFSCIEVPAGRGEFAWNDYNADGIPQLNEFELALFPDQAKYIRVFTPTNQFVKANYVQFNYAIALQPKALSNKIKSKNWRNFITRFMLQSSMQNSKKALALGKPLFNPLERNLEDTALITANENYSNTIAFNRLSTKWGIDITNIKINTKALLTYGFESRQTDDYTIKTRANFKKQYMFEVIQRISMQQLTTPTFNNRNYYIEMWGIEPKLYYIYLTKLRLVLSYNYQQKKNELQYGGEKSVVQSIAAETKYNAINNISLFTKFTYSNIQFSGVTNTTISYIMLDGLQKGKNYLWTIDLTKRLGNNLELNFSYEGRKSESSKIINIGRVGLRALL